MRVVHIELLFCTYWKNRKQQSKIKIYTLGPMNGKYELREMYVQRENINNHLVRSNTFSFNFSFSTSASPDKIKR